MPDLLPQVRHQRSWNERVWRGAAAAGAVREPLPPRPTREVQGLGARPRVDARAAGRADARLPRRVLGALARRGDRPRRLLALPPVRAAAVGVLRRVAADWRAEPRRERAADPQGALPPPARPSLCGRHTGRRVRCYDSDRAREIARASCRETVVRTLSSVR